jgi:hypothetical protein
MERRLYDSVVAAGSELGTALPDDRGISPVLSDRFAAKRVGHLVRIGDDGAVARGPKRQRVESCREPSCPQDRLQHRENVVPRRARHAVLGTATRGCAQEHGQSEEPAGELQAHSQPMS